MPSAKIYRNDENRHAKHPPSEEQAKKAAKNLNATEYAAEHHPARRNEKAYTRVSFEGIEGHYETTYPNALAEVVKDNSRAQSWEFDWGG